MNGADRVEFPNVEVLDASGLVLRCRIGDKIVGVPPLRLLPGTTIGQTGDRGMLVLEREVARDLGLAYTAVQKPAGSVSRDVVGGGSRRPK
jgi:hypothetical protein